MGVEGEMGMEKTKVAGWVKGGRVRGSEREREREREMRMRMRSTVAMLLLHLPHLPFCHMFHVPGYHRYLGQWIATSKPPCTLMRICSNPMTPMPRTPSHFVPKRP